ncbi:MAG: VOC family protein [Myxococcales bacterium]|nr:VOC family protein [Myxococcales bacterium]
MSNHDQASKPCPKPWPRISSSLFYADAAKALDWLCEAFGFEVILKVEGEGGRIEHSELMFGDGLIMVSQVGQSGVKERPIRGATPRTLDRMNTQMLCVCVDDVDAHAAHAKRAGATILSEPETTDYGEGYWVDRGYLAEDLEGHQWYFQQRLKTY